MCVYQGKGGVGKSGVEEEEEEDPQGVDLGVKPDMVA
jgi:hypothetical protein